MSPSEHETLLQYYNNQIERKKSKPPEHSLSDPLKLSALLISQITSMNDVSESNPDISKQDIMVIKFGSQRLDDQLEEVSYEVTHLKVIAKDIEQEVVQENQAIPDTKVRKALSKVRWNN